ncbi:MAG: NAD(P)H-hydrate dehydratase [Dehalococcoidia bacterium]|nr:NAD(P)H-hydrate dehydratase [Dehalococcoidia bacterium]
MKIVTIEQMRRLEEASASAGVSTDTLMENAGLAVAREVRKSLGGVAGSRILVLVGPGNNGGDGLVVARHLRRWGAEVTVYLLLRHRGEDPKFQAALEAGVSSLSTSQDPDLGAFENELANSHVVIDAVLGTGRARPLEGMLSEAMLRLSAAKVRRPGMTIISLDLPTGMDADTGRIDTACPKADITVTFGYPKVGHFRSPGAEKRGRLEVLDIGIPNYLAHDINLELLTGRWVSSKLPTRPPDGHKGTFGHVLVIAGSRNYPGAAYLASQGAARVGPGLVTLASPQSIYPILASKLTEVIHLPLPDDEYGRFHPDGVEIVRENLYQYDILLVGCGFGRSEGLAEFLRRLLIEGPPLSLPVVIDADGLNNLSKIEDWWDGLKFPAVLTPHPGEMSTLTGVSVPDVQSSRTEVALEWASRWNAMVVLKGAYTVVASPAGVCHVNPFANPALASGGTGDVLTGVIAGLMAQGLSPEDASCCGVYLHGCRMRWATRALWRGTCCQPCPGP